VTAPRLTPSAFERACESMRAVNFRSDITVREIPSPSGVAPQSFALAADVLPAEHAVDSEHGTGRIILLHDDAQPEAWGGEFRLVAFAQAPLETEIGLDPFLSEVAWSWLIDALDQRGAGYAHASGTATRILSTGFGELAAAGDGAQIELRASWSPTDMDFAAHAESWAELVCMLAGLPPTTEAVSLTARKWGNS
jgi:hypothetical protein